MSRTHSSAAGVSLARKVTEWATQFRLLWRIRFPFVARDFSCLGETVAEYDAYVRRFIGRTITGCRVLEIGFGQRPYRLYALHALGVDVVGCDLDHPVLGPSDVPAVWRNNGAERALKSTVRYLLFDLAEERHLNRYLSGLGARPFRVPRERLVRADAADPAFWRSYPGTYDLIYSEDVFEHIPEDDLSAVARLMAGHLSPTGIALIRPMVWTGIKGGHHVAYYDYRGGQPPAQVPPWSHLRDQRHPANTYLNRLSRRDYRRLFTEAGLQIIEEREMELGLGRELLTPELRAELAAWDDDELLSNKVGFVVRRRE